MAQPVAYLDASAIVKLIVREAETDALIEALRALPERASSEIARVEVLRVVRRVDPRALPRARRVLEEIVLMRLSRPLQEAAGQAAPPALRALDAIHLASALELADHLGPLVSYDHRLLDAARAAGIDVLAPGGSQA